MKTKNLSKADTLELIELYKNRIEFNNRLNKIARDFMKKNDIKNFNGWHDAPTPEMIQTMRDVLSKEEWMPEELKRAYLRDMSGIFGGTHSVAVNSYVRIDLQDLEGHLKELEHAENNSEESYDEFGFNVERDIENTRLNLFFDSVPEEEVRSILKSSGFKWSPYLKAWTRQLTPNAESSLRRVVKMLKEKEEGENN